MFLFILYTILVPYWFGNYRIGNRFFLVSQVFVFYLAYCKNIYVGRHNDNIKMLKYLVPIIIFTSVVTLFELQINPSVSRALKTGEYGTVDAQLKGIGGYELIYSLVILMPILFTILRRKILISNKRLKLLLWLIVVLFGTTIILSNYAIAFLLLFFTIVYIYFFSKLNSIWIIFITAILLLLIVYSQTLISTIINLLIYVAPESLNTERLIEIERLLLLNEIGISIEYRLDTYLSSIFVIYEYPIFGVIFENIQYGANKVRRFGQHSQILDTFALFGFMIGVLQIYLFSKIFFLRLKVENKELRRFTFIVFFIFFILISSNNLTASMAFATFFVFPTIYDLYYQ